MINLPSEPKLSHFKDMCIVCECENKNMSKEHIYPQWLLDRTKTRKEQINWIYGKASADKCTIPICEECNHDLGTQLEGPVSSIFESIESGNGFNDYEAELLIRWMWKIKGMFYWSICNENWKYGFTTLKDRVLSRIEQPRNRLAIAISLIEDAEEEFGSSPIGLDAFAIISNVYCVGVFSKISIAVIYSEFETLVDKDKWTVYTLSSVPLMMNPNYRVYPMVGFKTGREAIHTTKLKFGNNSIIYNKHELYAFKYRMLLKKLIYKK